jgi:4-hydroxy-4-methyl-2-oxoglutarate aldolase
MENHSSHLSRERLEELRRFDTCTISNAIERLNVRLRNEGFIHGATTCRFPDFPPVIGYAVTGRIRTSMTPVSGRWYHENIEFWRYVETIPAPRIIVLRDSDHAVGLGALFGEIHARICRALDCVAYVTNGAVRDLPGIQNVGIQLFAGSVSVSHAYAHVADFGEPVEIGGLRISPGDLLHGDLHGVQTIPLEVAQTLPEMAEQVRREEQRLFRLCDRKDFSVDLLEDYIHRVETEVCD